MTGRAPARPLTDDAFLGGALQMLQPKEGYRAGVDAVLLAASAPATEGRGQRILDVGAGVGVVGLAVARRVADASVVLVEREPKLAEIARSNIERNGLAARVRVVVGDVSRPLEDLPELEPEAGSFDHVLANPPYNAEGAGTLSVDALKAAANFMPGATLARWARFMAAMARPGGTATIIHRADALGEVITALAGRFGGTIAFPLYPRAGRSAIRVLVQGVKGSSAPLELRPGLVLHGEGNRFTAEVEAVLRHGSALTLAETEQKGSLRKARTRARARA
jgi:tRNA1(Val) A37 N6-methylase TrmN6